MDWSIWILYEFTPPTAQSITIVSRIKKCYRKNVRLEHYSQEKLKGKILDIVGKYLDLTKYKVFFFGSRVAGKGDERSDIDVGIEGPQPAPDIAMANIREKIEGLPILYKIDIIDFARADEKFKKIALRHIETMN